MQIKNTAYIKQTQNKSFTYKLIMIFHIIALKKFYADRGIQVTFNSDRVIPA